MEEIDQYIDVVVEFVESKRSASAVSPSIPHDHIEDCCVYFLRHN
jgi:hypothetical protein